MSTIKNGHESRARRVALAAVTVLIVATGGIIAVSRWLGLGPYGGSAEGIVVSKNMLVVQGRGTTVEYFVSVRASDGTISRVAVTNDLYRKIDKGWRVRQVQSVVTATSPDGTSSTISSIVN